MFPFQLSRDELQDRLGGGLPEGALVILEGGYGSGKSILLERLLYGAVENGASASVVSTELTTSSFLEQMYNLDYDVEEALLGQRLVFVPVYPVFGWRAPKADLLDKLLHAKRLFEKDLIAIDCFSSLLKNYIQAAHPGGLVDVSDKVEEALYLFKLLNAQGKTVILTIEPNELPPEVISAFQGAADVYLNLKLDVVGNTVSRSVLVRRFERPAKAVGDIIFFRVEPKVGFVVEIKSVS